MSFLARFSLFLAPSLLTTVVSFVMVPVTTYFLGPSAFGVFGLMTALTAVGWTFSLIGSGAVCNMHFPKVDIVERRRLVSTLLVVALGIGFAFCAILLAAWPLAVSVLDGYASVPLYGFLLSLLSVILGIPWIVAQDVITLDGRARGFAAVTIAQTITTAIVTVTALYLFHAGIAALFVSAVAGSIVTALGAFRILRPYLTTALTWRWVREVIRIGPANAWASVSDALQAAIERALLASMFGVTALGLYVHAQNYRVIIAQVLNAAARPIWPTTLLEAREPATGFPQTRIVWNAMYIAVTAVGITFAVFGRHIIDLLTHGRFVEAHLLVPWLVTFLLVQNSGKPQTGIVFREGAVRQLYWIQLSANVTWLLCLVLFIQLTGVVGAVLALIAQQIVVRLGVLVLARKRGGAPFADGWLLAGIVMIIATVVVIRHMPATYGAELAVWLTAMGLLTAFAMRAIRQFVRTHIPQLEAGLAIANRAPVQ